MRLHPFLFSFLLVTLWPFQAADAQKQAGKDASDAGSEKAQALIDVYQFEEAESVLQKEITTAQRKKRPTDRLSEQLHQAQLGSNMLAGTEKVVFIDSMAVPKKQFLSRFHLSEGCGRIDVPSRILESLSTVKTGESGYLNELEDRMFFAAQDARGRLRLYSSDKLGNNWSKPQPLAGLEGDSLQDYPFLMPDGVTFYYAAQNEKSLGGYDIFVTRYDADTHQYLQPENIGMPFNSPANDYLYVIDEQAQIGWFVTDRNQPADSVCIYRFIPSTSREVYEWTEENEEAIREAARIVSVKASQVQQESKVAAALERLKNIGQEADNEGLNAFRFILNDQQVYTSLSQFKKAQSREMAANWSDKCQQLDSATEELDKLRVQYHANPDAALRKEILRLEPLVQQLQAEVHELAKAIRRIELQ